MMIGWRLFWFIVGAMSIAAGSGFVEANMVAARAGPNELATFHRFEGLALGTLFGVCAWWPGRRAPEGSRRG